jgi:CBS domain containing-hemolysin-like protein
VIGALIGVGAVLLLIAANGLFVAAEFALVAVEPTQVDAAVANGERGAGRVRAAIHALSFHLSSAQLGITVTSLVVGYIAEPSIARLLRPVLTAVGAPHGVAQVIAVVLALAIATVTQMVLGELVPKNWAVSTPMRVARAVAGPQLAFSVVFRPVVLALNAAANRLIRALGAEPTDELRSARSVTELGSIVRSSAEQGTLPFTTATLLGRTLRFGERTAEDVMTPRVRVVALAATASATELLDTAEITGHSRFPVLRAEATLDPGAGLGDDLDNVVGVVHVKDAFGVPPPLRRSAPLASLMTDPIVVPSSLGCDALLARLRDRGLQMAVVIDEYGGTAGVVTLEDLVEELVGPVDDEYDETGQQDVVARPGGGWTVSGLLRLDEVTEATGVRLPAGPYETVAGLVLSRLGRLARVGDTTTADGYTLTVAAIDRHRVDQIVITPTAPKADGPDGDGPGGPEPAANGPNGDGPRPVGGASP